MYVFLDIDGTLVDEVTQEFPESAQRACLEARENGHKLLLCTGRVHQEVYPWLWDYTWDGAITASGAHGEFEGTEYVSSYMDPTLIHKLVKFMQANHIDYALQGDYRIVPNTHYLKSIADLASHWTGTLPELIDLQGPFYERFEAPTDEVIPDVRKVVFLGGGDASIADLREMFGKDLAIVDSSVDVYGSGGGEITSLNINKGTSIIKLIEAIGASMDDTIGIGDSMNDREMMHVCGTSVAMGNGRPEIKRAADIETTALNDDGIAHAFEMLGLVGVAERS